MSATSPEGGAPAATTGKAFWRSLDEMANTPEFRAWVERELPSHAEELIRRGGGIDRRKFLTLMGASLGLAGMSGCWPRRGSQKILTYDKKPESVIPGLPTFYATAMPVPGGAQPLLAESHNGRPTKLEGNPKASESLGASSAHAQASVLDLYDPDRSRDVQKGNRRNQTASSWAEFDGVAAKLFEGLKAKQGEGLSLLVGDISSPSFDLIKAHYAQALPKAKWFSHEPITDANAREGWKLALGADARPRYDFAKAKVVVSVDSDFLGLEEDNVRHVRGWADARRVTDESTEMSRLYVVEPAYTVTGGMADHRLRLPAVQAQDYLLALARKLAGSLEGANAELKAALEGFRPTPEIDSRWIDLVAEDLLANKGHSILIVGRRQPATAHALAAVINDALGNVGADKPIAALKPAPAIGGTLADLAADLAAGKVDTLVILGPNPVYNAPADLDFAKAMESAKSIIRWGIDHDETARKADWDLPGAHYLESWGDARGADGTLYPIQPIIEPLFGGRGFIELLASWGGYPTSDPMAIAQEAFRKAVGAEGWEPKWREFLHNGFHLGTPEYVAKPADQAAVAAKLRDVKPAPELSAKYLELAFQRDAGVDDGRYANNGWLQEAPDPITKLTWDNAALLSPSTAREFGLGNEDMIEITAEGQSLTVPVLVAPGQANHSISLALGYGRTVVGRVGQGTGFNAYLLRTSGKPDIVPGASIRPTGKTYTLATTQEHFTFDGWVSERVEELVQLQDFRPAKPGSNGHAAGAHGKDEVAPAAGHESNGKAAAAVAAVEAAHGKSEANGEGGHGHHHNPDAVGWKEYRRDFLPDITNPNPDLLTGEHAWGMAIDMNVCVGCTACVVACQAENNIPIVGKSEVLRGREMHWIRNDRYFTGEDPDNPGMVMQAMTCQHCENAPCEAVCPVNATTHSDEGLNLMAYNRCIGTRYCANNCPYKVRRFNYFNFNERKLGYGNLRWPEPYGPLTPRSMEETVKMQKNPDVTVRIRGVIEKCTYCVQRVERAKIGARVAAGQSDDIKVKDGGVTPACAQACSAQAIVFGDLKDENSRVSKLKASQRDFLLIGEVNTKPRTSYLRRLRNPHPRWEEAGAAESSSKRSEG